MFSHSFICAIRTHEPALHAAMLAGLSGSAVQASTTNDSFESRLSKLRASSSQLQQVCGRHLCALLHCCSKLCCVMSVQVAYFLSKV